MKYEKKFEATELRLGLPGGESNINQTAVISATTNKRLFHEISQEESTGSRDNIQEIDPPSKPQVVGWPPVRSYMKIYLKAKKMDEGGGIFVKVSMDGAPYLRKIDLKVFKGYPELFKALESMFKFQIGKNLENYVSTYEDKDGDWMLVGDVPWNMFINSCKRLIIMKCSEARGSGCAL